MKIKHFGKNIQPKCSYCMLGKMTGDYKMVICQKKGIVHKDYACKKFIYCPLKRVPMPLPIFKADEDIDLSL